MISVFAAVLRRDLRLALRRAGDMTTVAAFFAAAAILFPLGVGPDPATLARIAPGVLWAAALFSAMLSLDRLFAADREDGSLDPILLAPAPLEVAVLAKCLAHWLTTGLPVALLAPAMAALLQLDGAAWLPLTVALLLGTPSVSLVGAVGAALVLGARRGGALVGLLVLPLFVPVLVFGVLAVEAALAGLPVWPAMLIELALLALVLPLAAFAGAGALRLALA